jgi:selenocysteine-specific elongation factor
MKVLATAGHVDHGKSALVEALTGTHPDRLKEEREREMTIDLGFAWLDLPGGERVGIIDVPGHIDFIDNMLAGVGGIDAVLVVVAADEGIMPQTREHVAILDLLGVERGLGVVTKVDLVEDAEWLDFVKEDVHSLLGGTSLRGAEIVTVSAHTGEGLDDLKQALKRVVLSSPPRMNMGKPRLPIDRSFTIAGFGTIVTGTLADGNFAVGDEVLILPGAKDGRIRALQTHHEEIELAIPGSRVAINIAGVDVEEVERGRVVTKPGQYQLTRRMDVHLRVLADAPQEIKHDQQVKFFHYTAQRQARVRLLGADRIERGETGWVQLEFQEAVVAAMGDPIIVRRPSPGATLGGGEVVDPHPARRHRRKDQAIIHRLDQLLNGGPDEMIEAALKRSGAMKLSAVAEFANLDPEEVQLAARRLVSNGRVVEIQGSDKEGNGDKILIDKATWDSILERLRIILQDYHRRFPLRRGIPTQELRSKVPADSKLKKAVLKIAEREGVVDILGEHVAMHGFKPQPTDREAGQIEEIMRVLAQDPYATPSTKDLKGILGDELLGYMHAEALVVSLSEDVIVSEEAYRKMVHEVMLKLQEGGTVTIAEVRDMFDTSRRYALALMEHLDHIKLTVREGDLRRLA